MNFDYTIHVAELFVVAGAAWAVIRKLTRIADALSDFPPHRHVNGRILYPKGFEPSTAEELFRP